MRFFSIFVGLSLFVVAATESRAQLTAEQLPIRFTRAVDVEPHLPQSSVYEIVEDRRGFLWFATREGLGRWDGYSMRTWRVDPFNEASLPGNVVRELVEDGDGNLWVRTETTDRNPSGIARLAAPAHDAVERYGHLDAHVFIGPDSIAWLADSDSLYRFNARFNSFEGVRARVSVADPSTGYTDRNGTIWLSTSGGLEVYPAERNGEAARLLVPDIQWPDFNGPAFSPFGPIVEDAEGTIWIGGRFLGRVPQGGERIELLPLTPPEIAGYGEGFGFSQIIPGPNGELWLGSLDGVYHYAATTGVLNRYSLRLPGDIPTQNWITALHRDRAGTLWAGTVWGLHNATPFGETFRLLAHDADDPNSLGSGIILSIFEDVGGALWVGTLGGGLNRIDATTGRVTRFRNNPRQAASLSHDWIWSLRGTTDRVWVGTGGGLDYVDLANPLSVHHQQFDLPIDAWGPSAGGLHLDETGTLWLGYAGHLIRQDPDGTYVATAVPDGGGIVAVRTVARDAWVATSKGLLRFDAVADTFRAYHHDPTDSKSLSADAVITLHLDNQNRLWVGTQSGLNRYDAATDGFDHFSSVHGLPSDVVYAILDDDDGRLWMSTNRGLARYDEQSAGPKFRAFTFADGVGNVEFNQNAAFRGRDGRMFFGGDRGVTVFHPNAIRDNPYRPPVVITALHRATRGGTETIHAIGPEPVEISPAAYTFTFEFAALAFKNPHRNQYAVQMEGWDDDWVDLGTQRQATYTNLPPGRYTFRVRASNEDGLWNEEGIAVPIIVRPRLWQTWWFRAFLVLTAVAIVAFVVWIISRRRYERELARLEAHRALESERSRISRDMHDEVGASLSEIAILSELARRELDRPAAADDRLERIAVGSRAMLDSLGQIVWAINPKNDRLPALAGYLREHAARYLDAAELPATLNFPANVANDSVTAEVRRNVFLILKEALHNVVKHANANQVSVTLTVEDDQLTLVVKDDGVGFVRVGGDGVPLRTADGFHGGNGLGNMHRRAREINGVLDVATMPDRGTTLQLTAPLSAPSAVSD